MSLPSGGSFIDNTSLCCWHGTLKTTFPKAGCDEKTPSALKKGKHNKIGVNLWAKKKMNLYTNSKKTTSTFQRSVFFKKKRSRIAYPKTARRKLLKRKKCCSNWNPTPLTTFVHTWSEEAPLEKNWSHPPGATRMVFGLKRSKWISEMPEKKDWGQHKNMFAEEEKAHHEQILPIFVSKILIETWLISEKSDKDHEILQLLQLAGTKQIRRNHLAEKSSCLFICIYPKWKTINVLKIVVHVRPRENLCLKKKLQIFAAVSLEQCRPSHW